MKGSKQKKCVPTQRAARRCESLSSTSDVWGWFLLRSMRLIHLSRMCTMWVSEVVPIDPTGLHGFFCLVGWFFFFFYFFGPLIRHLRHKTMRNCKQAHFGSPRGMIPGCWLGDSSPRKSAALRTMEDARCAPSSASKHSAENIFTLGVNCEMWQRLATDTLAPSCSLVTQVSFIITVTSGFCWGVGGATSPNTAT